MMALINTWPARLTWTALAVVWLCACTTENTSSVFQRGVKTQGSDSARPQPTGTRAGTRAGTPAGPEAKDTAPRKTNIHFSSKYCLDCHETKTIDRQTKSLKYNGDFKKLCLDCHSGGRPIHFHPLQTRPNGADRVVIPSEFPLNEGRLDCRTCHDIYLQCRDSEADKLLLKGQMLLRGMPYKSRLAFCYQCHNTARYPRYNPHQQIDGAGKVMADKCLYCHTGVPDAGHTTYRQVKLISNYGELCKGCHYLTAKQPLHQRHLRKPTREVVERMKQMQAEFKIVLPLDQEGNVTCVTCHNPHQKGLIPDQRAGATGAGAAHRHRLAGNMCIKCHPMR